MQIDASIIVERIDSFRRALFQLVKTHHRVRDELFFSSLIERQFFMSLKNFLIEKLQFTPSTLPDDENLARWHPEFNLNQLAEIESSILPISPEENFKKLFASPVEIRRYAEKTPSERVKRALFSALSSDDVTSTITLPSPRKESISIDGISADLIEKVSRSCFSDDDDDEKISLFLRSVGKKLINFCAMESIKKNSFILDWNKRSALFNNTSSPNERQLCQSISSQNKFESVIRHLYPIVNHFDYILSDIFLPLLLLEQAIETLHYLHRYPANDGWMVIINLRGRDFIKINREKSINAIIDLVRDKLVVV